MSAFSSLAFFSAICSAPCEMSMALMTGNLRVRASAMAMHPEPVPMSRARRSARPSASRRHVYEFGCLRTWDEHPGIDVEPHPVEIRFSGNVLHRLTLEYSGHRFVHLFTDEWRQCGVVMDQHVRPAPAFQPVENVLYHGAGFSCAERGGECLDCFSYGIVHPVVWSGRIGMRHIVVCWNVRFYIHNNESMAFSSFRLWR